MTKEYIFSQIVVACAYICLTISYQLKSRNKILVFNLAALMLNSIAYILLSAYTGLAMSIVAILRNIIFMIDENKNGKQEKILIKDVVILMVIIVLIIISAIYTYNGLLSLLAVFATLIYTFPVWQKSTKMYKLLGMPVEILWILYNIYIKSIVGIVLEILLACAIVIGYYKEK